MKLQQIKSTLVARFSVVIVGMTILILAGCDAPRPPAEAAEASALTVEIIQPEKSVWPDHIRANGPIEAWQEIIVSPETGGLRLAELVVDVGAKVKRGDILARLADDSVRADLRKQQGLVTQARANLDKASSNLKRAKATGERGAYSAQQLEELQISLTIAEAAHQSAVADLDNAKLKLSQTRIIATDDGVVTAKTGVLGEVVNTGSEIYRMIRQGKLEWKPEVDARQLATIREGQIAQLTLPDGQTVKGIVRVASPTVNQQTGRAIVYVTLEADTAARAGMFASGIIAFEKREALSLPQTAIVLRDGRAYVWIIDKDSHVTSKVVTTGRSQGERIEIIDGIAANARVVAVGGAFLSEGAKVTIASTRAANKKVNEKTIEKQEQAQ